MLLLARRKRGRVAAFTGIGQINFVAGVTLFTAFVVGGSGYLIRELHRQAGVAWSATGLPQSAAPEIAQPLVTEEMLHVSSIALGRSPIALVNGAIVSEGATIQLSLPEGNVSLRVQKIRDGAVDFRYAGKTVSVNLGASLLKR